MLVDVFKSWSIFLSFVEILICYQKLLFLEAIQGLPFRDTCESSKDSSKRMFLFKNLAFSVSLTGQTPVSDDIG